MGGKKLSDKVCHEKNCINKISRTGTEMDWIGKSYVTSESLSVISDKVNERTRIFFWKYPILNTHTGCAISGFNNGILSPGPGRFLFIIIPVLIMCFTNVSKAFEC